MADDILRPCRVEDMVRDIEHLWRKYPAGIPSGAGIMPTHEFFHELCLRIIALEEWKDACNG